MKNRQITSVKFVLICLTATGANLFGFVFLSWGAIAAFIASGMFVFSIWKDGRSWTLKFFTAVAVFFSSAGLFYVVLPFLKNNWIRSGQLVLIFISFIFVYWLGCYLGTFFIRKPASNINPPR